MKRLFFVSLSLLLSCSGFASSRVLKVAGNHKAMAVSQDASRRWNVRDWVCVVHSGSEVACGKVLKVTPKVALVKLEAANYEVNKGDVVMASSTGGPRRPAAALMDSANTSDPTKVHRFNITAGMSAGLTFFFPMIHVQYALAPHWALGARSLYFSSSAQDASVSAMAGMVTLDYYRSGYFRGLWGELAGGMYSFSASTPDLTEGAKSLAFSGTIGYRYLRGGFNAGLAGGVQYIKDPALTTVDVRASGLQALVLLDIGYNF